jgi:hypothetical protein
MVKDIPKLRALARRKITFRVIYDEKGEKLDNSARRKIYTLSYGGHTPNSHNKTAHEHRLMNAVHRSRKNFNIPKGKAISPADWENIKDKFKQHVIDNELLLKTIHMLQELNASDDPPSPTSFVGMTYSNLMKNAANINKALSHKQNNPNSAHAFFLKVRNMNANTLYAQRRIPNAVPLSAPKYNINNNNNNNKRHNNSIRLQPYFGGNKNPNKDARAAANKAAANRAAANKAAANRAAANKAAANRAAANKAAANKEAANFINMGTQHYVNNRQAVANKLAASKAYVKKLAANKAAANNATAKMDAANKAAYLRAAISEPSNYPGIGRA